MSSTWATLARHTNFVVETLLRGPALSWRRVPDPPEYAEAFEASAPTFKILATRWSKDGCEGYAAIATVLRPRLVVINLPVSIAEQVFDKAASSLN